METYKLFVSYLVNRMIFERPSTDELKRITDNKLIELENHNDRVLMLKEIYNLRKFREIDTYYLGEISDFFNYVEYRYQEYTNELDKGKDWKDLYNELNESYITGVDQIVFNEVMNFKRLPNGKNKITWKGKKTEAVYFQKELGFTMAQFNSCFMWRNGSSFAEKNRHKTNPSQHLIEIVSKYKN